MKPDSTRSRNETLQSSPPPPGKEKKLLKPFYVFPLHEREIISQNATVVSLPTEGDKKVLNPRSFPLLQVLRKQWSLARLLFSLRGQGN
jgi:hypothetical protein